MQDPRDKEYEDIAFGLHCAGVIGLVLLAVALLVVGM